MTRTLRHLLLPMSANARKQDRIDSARQLAGLAVQLTPGDAASRLALARAEARAGNATEASVHGEIYLRIADTRAETEDGQQSGPAAVDLLKRDLEACYAAQRFGDLAASPLEVNLESDAWGSAEKTLWQEHELVALERGYERFLTGAPKDADALYQYAAVLVQLGALSRGREALLDAVELAPVNVLRNLRRDGRFVQLPEAQRSQDRV